MKRSISLLILLSLMMSLHVSAQDSTPQYRLRTPTAEEYLRAVPTLIELVDSEENANFDNLLFDEIAWRFTEEELADLSFDVLWAAFEKSLYVSPRSYEAAEFWLFALTTSGLREQMPDLSQIATLTIRNNPPTGSITLNIQPIDFNGDGTDEYILNITDAGFWNYFLVAQIDSTEASGYRLLTPPTPVYVAMGGDTQAQTIRIEDMNNDGLPEWAILYTTLISWTSMGKLYVVGWRDGALVDYAANGFGWWMPAMSGEIPLPQWDYTDDNTMTNITMRYRLDDGWGCSWDMAQTLHWQNPNPLTEAMNTYEDTIYCTIREAENAFAAGNYEEASDLYEEALNQPQDSPQLTQFMRSRLALAYALNGQVDETLAVLSTAEPTGLMGELLLRMRLSYQDARDLETLCFAAHDFYAATNLLRTDSYNTPYLDFPAAFRFGQPDDPHSIRLPDPNQVGCDVSQFQEAVPTAVETPISAYESYVREYGRWDLRGAFIDRDYAAVLEMLDSIFATMPDTAAQTKISELTYWRALTLEQLGETDDALAAYIAIYNAAPDSAWGQVAALHFEIE